jgi:hypothetical protein
MSFSFEDLIEGYEPEKLPEGIEFEEPDEIELSEELIENIFEEFFKEEPTEENLDGELIPVVEDWDEIDFEEEFEGDELEDFEDQFEGEIIKSPNKKTKK